MKKEVKLLTEWCGFVVGTVQQSLFVSACQSHSATIYDQTIKVEHENSNQKVVYTTLYYPNGNKKEEMELIDGKKWGSWVFFNSSGKGERVFSMYNDQCFYKRSYLPIGNKFNDEGVPYLFFTNEEYYFLGDTVTVEIYFADFYPLTRLVKLCEYSGNIEYKNCNEIDPIDNRVIMTIVPDCYGVINIQLLLIAYENDDNIPIRLKITLPIEICP